MLKDDIESLIQAAIKEALMAGELPRLAVPDVALELSTQGDYATSIAVRMARAARQSPMRVAQIIKNRLGKADFLGDVEVSELSYINFRLSNDWLKQQVEVILAQGQTYGNLNLGKNMRVQLEFVSANPTGPVTLAATRAACLGDTLASVLQAAGYYVEREYYVNDAGKHILAWNESVWAYYQAEFGSPIADDPQPDLKTFLEDTRGYARRLAAHDGDRFLALPLEEAKKLVGKEAIKLVLEGQEEDLAQLGVLFDVWFHEQGLYDRGEIDQTLALLREKGFVREQDNISWFSTTEGKDKDEMLVRADGSPTYFLADIAYHYNKFRGRGFQKVIDIWSFDHQYHISRMRLALEALGITEDRLAVLTLPVVNINQSVSGTTLREVMQVSGVDALRLHMLMSVSQAISYNHEGTLDFNVDLAIAQTNENPLYQLHNAYMQATKLLEQAAEHDKLDFILLDHSAELNLIRQLLRLPEVIQEIALTYEAQRLPTYALELSRAFNEVVELTNSPVPLKLIEATKNTLNRVFTLMGMNTSEN